MPHLQLLTLRWCTRDHGCDALWINVESQECERVITGVPPLVYEPERNPVPLSGMNSERLE